MSNPKKITKHEQELLIKIDELTSDLQRTRADFENYRKRVDDEKASARQYGQIDAIMKLLPTIDNIERATQHIPDDLRDNPWAQGVATLAKNLEKSLAEIGLTRVAAEPGTPFDPDVHNAVQFDEDSTGNNEIIAEELRSGYLLNGQPIRESMVRVKRQ